jgi:hypothetical protein
MLQMVMKIQPTGGDEKTNPISEARRDGEQSKRQKSKGKRKSTKPWEEARFRPYCEKTNPIWRTANDRNGLCTGDLQRNAPS